VKRLLKGIVLASACAAVATSTGRASEETTAAPTTLEIATDSLSGGYAVGSSAVRIEVGSAGYVVEGEQLRGAMVRDGRTVWAAVGEESAALIVVRVGDDPDAAPATLYDDAGVSAELMVRRSEDRFELSIDAGRGKPIVGELQLTQVETGDDRVVYDVRATIGKATLLGAGTASGSDLVLALGTQQSPAKIAQLELISTGLAGATTDSTGATAGLSMVRE
jgi:hypothetical protein